MQITCPVPPCAGTTGASSLESVRPKQTHEHGTRLKRSLPVVLACCLVACGGGGSGSTSNPTNATGQPDLTTPDNGNPPTGNATLLPALPVPSLTPGPSADDEPIPESGLRHSVTGFLPVRDNAPAITKQSAEEITLEEFLAGPLPPIIEIPPGIDPATNAAPFFEGLTDQELFAGDVLTLPFIPRDPEGDLPGLFPEELPEGGEFVDNFDGTKSLVWQPLQGDVGITEFTIVALDPLDSFYRTRQTIRIRVLMPDDPASIPNRPPRIEEFIPHTVRVNDPVAIELRGIDLNDTTPTLSIANLPPGGTFTRHPQRDDVFILRYIPTQTGVQTFDVVSIDADDPALTTTEQITIEVLSAASFLTQGPRLRDLAVARGLFLGFASRQDFYHRPDGEIYTQFAADEFNLVTPENSMKMEVLNPLPGRFDFADADNLMRFAERYGLAVHGHPLVWYTQLPEWINTTAVADRAIHLREYISRIVSRYADDVRSWDVVNEPVNNDGSLRDSVWLEGMGESYIDIAFRQTRELDPDAVLLLNEFDIEVDGPKADGFFSLVERLLERDVPLDAIGFQMHLFTPFDQFDEVRQRFQQAADLGLDIYITELDVSFPEGTTAGNRDFERQAAVYREITTLCLEQPRCRSIQTWGFTDQYSWREPLEPLLFDARYQDKPAYRAVQEQLTPP